jgi:Na+/phosphate symporter
MSGTLVIPNVVGNVVLLLWGMRMVQSGVERAFGSDLHRLLGRALRNRLVAAGAGAGVTMLLQSSTAAAMMVTSFAARGAVGLIPALAVMLGANVGTAGGAALILARVFGNGADFWLNVQRRGDLSETMNAPRERQRIERAKPLTSAA